MAYTSKHTGAQIDLAIGSGSTTTGVIKDFNTLSGSSTSTIKIGAGLIAQHITASGNISASGNLTVTGNTTIAGNTTMNGNITLGNGQTDNIVIKGDISSSFRPNNRDKFDIGSSSFAFNRVYVNAVHITGSTPSLHANGTERLSIGATNIFTGNLSASGAFNTLSHITASGNISGSSTSTLSVGGTGTFGGNISALTSTGSFGSVTVTGQISSSGALIADLPTEAAKAATGGLFTLSGSQLPFATGSNGSTVRALFNEFSSSKFVLIK